MAKVLDDAKCSRDWMKKACQGGRWLGGKSYDRPGRLIAAKSYGFLVVFPGFKCILHGVGADNCWVRTLPRANYVANKRPKPSGWPSYRGRAAPGSDLWPSGESNWEEHNAKRVCRRPAAAASATVSSAHPKCAAPGARARHARKWIL